MTDIYHKNILDYTTSIVPKEINKNINITLTRKLKDDLEGKCIKEGYVKKDSIKIISRSLGEVLLSHFNGTILYHIKFQAEICNPLEGMIIDAQVTNINKMGALAEIEHQDISPVAILIAKQHHIDNVNFENLKKGDNIKVKVLGKRYEYGDTQISIIGLLNDEMSSKSGIYQKSPNSSVSSISDVESVDEPDDDEDEESEPEVEEPTVAPVEKKPSPVSTNILSKLSGVVAPKEEQSSSEEPSLAQPEAEPSEVDLPEVDLPEAEPSEVDSDEDVSDNPNLIQPDKGDVDITPTDPSGTMNEVDLDNL